MKNQGWVREECSVFRARLLRHIGSITEGFPYPGAKACFLISGDKWDDRNWLSELIKISAAELPMPKKKAPRKK